MQNDNLVHQEVVVDGIEVGLQITIHCPLIALLTLFAHVRDGGVSLFTFSETIAVLTEVLIKDRTEHLSYGLLDDSIQYGGDTQGAFLSVWLWYPDSAYWCGCIVPLPNLADYPWEVGSGKLRKVRYRHPVDTGGSLVRLYPFPCTG